MFSAWDAGGGGGSGVVCDGDPCTHECLLEHVSVSVCASLCQDASVEAVLGGGGVCGGGVVGQGASAAGSRPTV